MAEPLMAYVAIHKACGQIAEVAVDEPEHAREVAQHVASWIRRGHTVERRTVEDVRTASWCECF